MSFPKSFINLLLLITLAILSTPGRADVEGHHILELEKIIQKSENSQNKQKAIEASLEFFHGSVVRNPTVGPYLPFKSPREQGHAIDLANHLLSIIGQNKKTPHEKYYYILKKALSLLEVISWGNLNKEHLGRELIGWQVHESQKNIITKTSPLLKHEHIEIRIQTIKIIGSFPYQPLALRALINETKK